MSTKRESKINQLLQHQPAGTVFLASWMEKHGYSRDLQKRYRSSGWLESVGFGAMKRTGEDVDWLGALYSLQKQGGYDLHAGGRTALSLHGLAHNIEMGRRQVYIYMPYKVAPPKWFTAHDWGVVLHIIQTNFLPAGVGLVSFMEKGFEVSISSPTRALMEFLYHAPGEFEFLEAYYLMEHLNNLRPAKVQQLLEKSTSVKVNRLFLYLAQKAGHTWFSHIDLSSVNLGKGKRSIAKGGVLIKEWQITVPRELDEL